ncbi:MAG: ATP-binding cassette domain-containing protein [Bacteroidaceae bacterium]|nr:ATP-binding cassette domain-containing protein [Bacteroidaceae bacterium]MBO4430071.1 ATP-binding cassette domain-containing protein [Bacteroidaceae bacterium]
MNLIDYKDVNIYQESQLVLQDVNVEIGEGEFVYLTGKVGTGKSSFLKTIYGELPLKEGEAKVMGHDMVELKRRHLPDLRKKLGIIFQDFQLLTDRTVDANLRFVLKATGWKNKVDINQRISDVLELVGMSTKGYKMPSELSGGEQQRIVIARAILNSPKLILADEPTGNLDAETSRQIVELLQQISKAGSTVVMITHNQILLEQFPGRQLLCENHQLTEVTPQKKEPETTEELD